METSAAIVSSEALRWIILLPLIGMGLCALGAQVERPVLARAVGPLVVLGAFLLALLCVSELWRHPAGTWVVDNLYTWIKASPFKVEAALRLDALSSVMVLVITGVGFLIHL